MSVEPTSPPTERLSTFHSDDVEGLTDYRTLSVSAIVSLVIGLLSLLAFTAPLARVIPVIGIVAALVALRRIAVSNGNLAGSGAAKAGLALSIASLLAVLSYNQVMKQLQVRRAEEFGRQWLQAVQAGDTRRAFRLTMKGAEPDLPADQPGAPPKNPYDEFLENPLIRRLVESGASGRIDLQGTYAYEHPSQGQFWIGQRFLATSSKGAPFQADLRLQLGRLPGEGQPRWLVLSHQLVDGSADSEADDHQGHSH